MREYLEDTAAYLDVSKKESMLLLTGSYLMSSLNM